LYFLTADSLVLLHFAFVLFVVLGGLLVLRWSWVAYLHVPAAVWGALIEFTGWVCPLTPLEHQLRSLGGGAGYRGGFIEHYILGTLYPSGLTRGIQLVLGTVVLVLNCSIYLYLYLRRRRNSAAPANVRP
jgi:hypothetical protein